MSWCSSIRDLRIKDMHRSDDLARGLVHAILTLANWSVSISILKLSILQRVERNIVSKNSELEVEVYKAHGRTWDVQNQTTIN